MGNQGLCGSAGEFKVHKFFYSDHFDIPLPEKHRFPNKKYSALRKKLLDEKILREDQLYPSPLATENELKLVHSNRYVDEFCSGEISETELKRIGFPWSEHLVIRSKATVGGAIEAAKSALISGISGQLAGGTHHAHFDFGSGYCVFNDFAVAALKLIEEDLVSRLAIVDLDVHQGDGNASILSKEDQVFVFSMHGEKNFPFRKHPSDLDIGLKDGCEDEEFLEKLYFGLKKVNEFEPEIVLFQAGVDVLSHDKLGRMNISYKGLMERDLMVFKNFKSLNIPVSMAIGGGYSDPIEHSVDAYVQTYKAAKSIYSF